MSEQHDTDCEREYTENGFVFIDCLCSLRKAKADAWDEGFKTGVALVERGFASPNPHRRG